MVLDYNTIGKRIKVLRKKSGLTQEIISEKLHLTRSHYAAIESGKRRAPLELLVEICSILDTDLNSLVRDPILSNWIPADFNQYFRGMTDEQIEMFRNMLIMTYAYNQSKADQEKR